MYCAKCQKHYPETAMYCGICGQELETIDAEVMDTEISKEAPIPAPKNKKIHLKSRKGIIALALCLLAVGGVVGFVLTSATRNYEKGMSYFSEERYVEAYKALSLVACVGESGPNVSDEAEFYYYLDIMDTMKECYNMSPEQIASAMQKGDAKDVFEYQRNLLSSVSHEEYFQSFYRKKKFSINSTHALTSDYEYMFSHSQGYANAYDELKIDDGLALLVKGENIIFCTYKEQRILYEGFVHSLIGYDGQYLYFSVASTADAEDRSALMRVKTSNPERIETIYEGEHRDPFIYDSKMYLLVNDQYGRPMLSIMELNGDDFKTLDTDVPLTMSGQDQFMNDQPIRIIEIHNDDFYIITDKSLIRDSSGNPTNDGFWKDKIALLYNPATSHTSVVCMDLEFDAPFHITDDGQFLHNHKDEQGLYLASNDDCVIVAATEHSLPEKTWNLWGTVPKSSDNWILYPIENDEAETELLAVNFQTGEEKVLVHGYSELRWMGILGSYQDNEIWQGRLYIALEEELLIVDLRENNISVQEYPYPSWVSRGSIEVANQGVFLCSSYGFEIYKIHSDGTFYRVQ